MRSQLSTVLLGMAALTTAQNLHQEGPYAFHVKGQAKNSTIDGYLHTVDLGTGFLQKPIQYEPISAPPLGNETYQFWFNYTGNSQSMGTELGIIITDPKTASNADASFHGKAMSLMYSPGSNVAFPLVGAGAANTIGFDATNKTFIDIIFNDATFVPNQTPSFDQSYDFYNWAICWQFFGRVYMPTLSWITSGPSHNPTCERIDLIREAL